MPHSKEKIDFPVSVNKTLFLSSYPGKPILSPHQSPDIAWHEDRECVLVGYLDPSVQPFPEKLAAADSFHSPSWFPIICGCDLDQHIADVTDRILELE